MFQGHVNIGPDSDGLKAFLVFSLYLPSGYGESRRCGL